MKKNGFTLIELVMVIVILGILAAFALPKFADLSGDAEIASCRGGLGAVKSAAGITHAAFLAGGSTAPTIEGNTVTMAAEYPDSTEIEDLANLSGFTVTTTATTAVVTLTGSTSTFTYNEADGTGTPPTYTAFTNCGS